MTTEPTATAPFGNIALCLSGGGYRAATYSLGTVDILDELGLLDSVKLLSTVSGGSFTGVCYAAWMAEGKRYGEFYKDFYTFLKDTNCVQLALDDLYNTPSPSGRDDLSLIRSAAKAYNENLFKGRTFSLLMGETGKDKRFLELIHNSTEFRKGNSFRMRSSWDPDVFAGNGDFRVEKSVASEILLADIVAASSCFPGAFEPLRFPEDFIWNSGLDDVKNRLIQNIGKFPSGFENDSGHCISLPLMDGGIYDNQGVSNAVLADRTLNKSGDFFGLFLISDTSPRNNDMLHYPKPDTKDGWLSLNSLFWVAVALFIVAAVSAGSLIYYLVTAAEVRALSWTRFIFQYISPIVLFGALMMILGWTYNLFRKNKVVVVSGVKFPIWDAAKRLSLPDFINMAKARFTSLGTMAGDVFMKRIRQLQFNNITGDPERKTRVGFDLIYDMNPTAPPDDPPVWKLDPDLEPTGQMKNLSKLAENLPTTLWFPVSSDLDLLVTCGQCTTVYSLLRYLWRRWYLEGEKGPKPNDPASPWYDTYTKLKVVWNKLKADPECFLNRAR